MTDTYLMPLAVRLASERVRADAANTMRHDTTSDLSARLMCRVGVHDLGMVMAWVDQFATLSSEAQPSSPSEASAGNIAQDEPIPSGDAASVPPCKSEWRPIESAPRDGTAILAASINNPTREVVCWQDGLDSSSPVDPSECEGWVNDGMQKDRFYANPRYFTHWMELPALSPQETSEP